jgi:spore germination cell wall hydrolase CwlJ-like protein
MKRKIKTGLIWLFALSLWADGEYSAHKTFGLNREEKIIAITILAEARGEGEKGMYAVAAVIAQRAFERKRTPSEICLKPYQFSCWNGYKKVKDLEHLLKVPQAKYAILIAKNIKLLSRDFVGYANHYHNNKIKTPYWAKGQKPVKTIGNHIFYKL